LSRVGHGPYAAAQRLAAGVQHAPAAGQCRGHGTGGASALLGLSSAAVTAVPASAGMLHVSLTVPVTVTVGAASRPGVSR